MIAGPALFGFVLINNGAILFLLIYYIITLSDLECDYLNAQECCSKLNFWLLPKYLAHSLLSFLLLVHGEWLLFFANLPMFLWLSYEYFSVPKGNFGAYDPAEIHNGGLLEKHQKNCVINIGYYLVFFFVYLYCLIKTLLDGDPLERHNDDKIITEL